MSYTNEFRSYRNKSPLTQEDLAFFLNLQSGVLLSLCENDKYKPSLQMVFIYHLLFDTPFLAYLNTEREKVRSKMLTQIPALIDRLSQGEVSGRTQNRISFLHKTLTRLINEPIPYDQQ